VLPPPPLLGTVEADRGGSADCADGWDDDESGEEGGTLNRNCGPPPPEAPAERASACGDVGPTL
jgi:hypothetical protein